LERMRIGVRPIVLGLGRLVEEIPAFPDVPTAGLRDYVNGQAEEMIESLLRRAGLARFGISKFTGLGL